MAGSSAGRQWTWEEAHLLRIRMVKHPANRTKVPLSIWKVDANLGEESKGGMQSEALCQQPLQPTTSLPARASARHQPPAKAEALTCRTSRC